MKSGRLRNFTHATDVTTGGADAVGAAVAEGGDATGGAAEADAAAETAAFAGGRPLAGPISPSRHTHDMKMAKRRDRTPLASANSRDMVKGLRRQLDFARALDETRGA